MRLSAILLDHSFGKVPTTYALSALMHLNAARLPARVDESGNLNSLFDQDRSKWDQELMVRGLTLLDLSATGSKITEYHLEAAIASIHTQAARVEETDWEAIVSLYDKLIGIRQSPIVALNRAIAVAQLKGAERGLEEIRAIPDGQRLAHYPFYYAALGEFELRIGRQENARQQFERALDLARNSMERRFLRQKINACAGAKSDPSTGNGLEKTHAAAGHF